MKRLLYIPLLAFLFIGCGTSVDEIDEGRDDGSTTEKKTVVEKNPLPKDKSYRLYDYLVPPSDTVVKSYKYKNDIYQEEESLAYSRQEEAILQRPLKDINGQVRYIESGDKIDVFLYQGDNEKSFIMQNFIEIGDLVTKKSGECIVSKHYDRFKYKGKTFDDVLEISCPTSIGYYQNKKGLVVENIIKSSLKESTFNPLPIYKDRKITTIDTYTPDPLDELNLDSAIESQANKLWVAPYNLNGEGMKIGVVDGGNVRATHVEFDGRVTNLSHAEYNDHTTHVTGTLIAAGRQLAAAHGFANKAEVYAFSYSDIYYAQSIKAFAKDYGIFISNHSYGYAGAEGLGEYDGISKDLDIAIHDNPYMLAIIAAGNDGGRYKDESDFREWGLIKGGSNAKNVITVGALKNDAKHIAYFSSLGPVDGGRLKPDIVMDGSNVLSTISGNDDDSYDRLQGTSMAAPAATGAITLLAQRYKQVMHKNITVDTMKAILFNTATDVENPGPDYKSGYGHINGLAAAKVIDSMNEPNTTLVIDDSIHKNDKQRYYINSRRYQDFKVTLAWVDDTYRDCQNCASDILINDIDMVLIDESSGEKIYPYTLNPNAPQKDALQSQKNHIDPQEQISYTLHAGNYILEISGYKISPAGQKFTLVTSMHLDDVKKEIALIPMDEHINKIYKTIK